MNRIEALLDELASKGVERKKLGDIAQLVRGHGMPKSDFVEDGVGAIHYGQIYTRYGVWTEQVFSFVTVENSQRLVSVGSGDLIVTDTSENLDGVCKAVAWLGDKVVVTGGHATVIKHRQNAKFLAYWFQAEDFFERSEYWPRGRRWLTFLSLSSLK